jgi:hypothetical protein
MGKRRRPRWEGNDAFGIYGCTGWRSCQIVPRERRCWPSRKRSGVVAVQRGLYPDGADRCQDRDHPYPKSFHGTPLTMRAADDAVLPGARIVSHAPGTVQDV